MTLRGMLRRPKDRKIVEERLQSGEYQKVYRAEHYQYLHEEFTPYMENNWLVDDMPRLRTITGGVVCEIGCGNGKFLKAAAPYFQKLVAVDWAKSPQLENVPGNIEFIQQDLSKGFDIDRQFDLMCSADFLEHLTLEAADRLIEQIIPKATYHYHKIACYDDGGSHLTILSPREWLKLFKQHDPHFYIAEVKDRRKNGQDVVVVTNVPKSLLTKR